MVWRCCTKIPTSRVSSPGARRVSNLELGSDCLLTELYFGALVPQCYFQFKWSKWSEWSEIDGAPGFENQF